jgi:energy-coupling factor transport system ATP-binding protein
MIQAEAVSFAYPSGVQALHDVNLRVSRGEQVALIGENGAGKTTLAKHFNSLLRPTDGRVMVRGRDTREETVAQMARVVGYVFQNPDEQLFQNRVFDEVAFGPRNLQKSEHEIGAAVQGALEKVGLAEKAEAHPFDLLPSERKMLGLATVLSMETPVLVMDEPTMGLDLFGLSRLSSILTEIRAAGRTVVAISHDLDFCAERFDRFILMAEGRILGEGSGELVFRQMDLLREAGLEPPQLVRLADGLGLGSTPLSVDKFLSDLEERRGAPS